MSVMRSLTVLPVVFLTGLCLLPTAALANDFTTEELVVTSVTAEVKIGRTVLATVRRGTRFPLGEVQGEWYRVRIAQGGEAQSGWIHKTDIRVQQSEDAAQGEPTAVSAPERSAGKKYAVLVGVEKYSHPSLMQPPLQYSVDDVTALAGILRKLGYEVSLLSDEAARDSGLSNPTRKNIETRIRLVLRKCGSEDTVLLAFAGHGLQFAGQQDSYFCPSDARPFSDETDSLVSMAGIYRELEKSYARTKLILVDACRNDPDPGRGRGLDAGTAIRPPQGVAALFSCSAGQKAFEHDELGHGVFFHHILEGLSGKAADYSGEISFESLAAYVRKEVPRQVDDLLPGRNQHPNLMANLTGLPPVLARVTRTQSRASVADSDRLLGAESRSTASRQHSDEPDDFFPTDPGAFRPQAASRVLGAAPGSGPGFLGR